MSKIVTLQLDPEVYRELEEAAAAERRSLSNLIETAALDRIREQQFVDDDEMVEILKTPRAPISVRKQSMTAQQRRWLQRLTTHPSNR